MSVDNCPECDSEDVTIDSCGSMMLSTISCDDCDYMMQASVCEETLEKRWNAKYKKSKFSV